MDQFVQSVGEALSRYGDFEGVLRLIQQYLLWGLNGTPGVETVAVLAAKLGIPFWIVRHVAREAARNGKGLAYVNGKHNQDVVRLREQHDEEG